MFTGLVQETGVVEAVRASPRGTRISVAAKGISRELKKGDSVAVSGVCLTAVEIGRGRFSADLAQETLRRTSLGTLRKGSLVNLELPARPQDRLGGHMVQGHVDGTGELISLKQIPGSDDWRLAARIPQKLCKYVVPQGSITVEGISLTLAKIEGMKLEIAIIPHTYQATNLKALRSGDPLNIEVDVLAKYVERLTQRQPAAGLSIDMLTQRGF
jgi:riboflavin synthase